jgi:hypothetical protein
MTAEFRHAPFDLNFGSTVNALASLRACRQTSIGGRRATRRGARFVCLNDERLFLQGGSIIGMLGPTFI